MVVRGTDNEIYCRNTSGGSWTGSWEAIPGATSDEPAIAIMDNKLHLVIRGTDDGIYYNMKDLSTKTWSGWVYLGATLSSPGFAITNYGDPSRDTLHLLVRGTDNGIYYNSWTSSGGWSSWQKLPGATNDAPSIVVGAINYA